MKLPCWVKTGVKKCLIQRVKRGVIYLQASKGSFTILLLLASTLNVTRIHPHLSNGPCLTLSMTPSTPMADDSHQQLLDQLDLTLKPRPFRNPRWKPSQRRNKNIKQMVAEASRKEASVMATQNNSGSSTPNPESSAIDTGAATPMPANGTFTSLNISQAAQNLSTMVLEKNLRASISSGPAATYTNIESAPSLHPAHQKRYCDITGLPAPYTDPKSRLLYHNKEIFELVRQLPQNIAEKHLEARGAHAVLK